MDIQSAQYVQDESGQNSCIKLVLASMPNDVPYLLVPLSNDNRHYQAIQEWVSEGNTIAEAD
tara:strand:- start:96 stop:281 length:186 start_codon:yes stop_codon:yes gene_type:complete